MTLIRRLILLLMLMPVIAQASIVSPIQPRIVGGEPSTSGEWPWMVALIRSGFPAYQGQFCGGSLVHESWVLTAAHCMFDSSGSLVPGDIEVSIGEYDLDDTQGQTRNITQIIVHPSYNEFTSDSDLALIRLETPVSGVDILPLVSPQQMDNITAGYDVTVIGWGDTQQNNIDPDHINSTFPSILRDVTLPYVTNETCMNSYGSQITENMLCAGFSTGGYDSCQGDSGGPLVFRINEQWHQGGVVSWGNGCALSGYYGVYTRMSNFNDWIDQVLNGLLITPVVDFDRTIVGISQQQEVIVTNIDPLDVTILSANLNNTTDITIDNNGCTNQTLVEGQSCIISLVFDPQTAGVVDGVLEITTTQSAVSIAQVQLQAEALATSDFDAVLGNPGLTWATGGDADWLVESATATEGSTAMQSGSIGNGQSSVLLATIDTVTDTKLYFDWRVCSEASFDFLQVLVDNVLVSNISGSVYWRSVSVDIPAGEHLVQWKYIKDGLVAEGYDTSWIDNVSVGSSSVSTPFGSSNCTPPASSSGYDFLGAASPFGLLFITLPALLLRRKIQH